jgi:sugar diacid utilization regulator
MDDTQAICALRAQMSNLCVFALAMMLFDRVDDDEILELVASTVPALGPCQVEGTYLLGDDVPRNGGSSSGLRGQLQGLEGRDGRVEVCGAGWAWAYPLRAVGWHSGYLVVTAGAEPSADEQFLVRTLAQQAGAALNSAALYHRERAASEELRERNGQLGAVNRQLTVAVADLERRTRMHEALTQVVATGGAEVGIAGALHELTGLGVVIEDRFGNLLASSGKQPAHPLPGADSGRRREELLDQVQRAGQPVRHRDRIVAVAQPRNEVLGVLALFDPDHRAGPYERLALENATVVLAMELAHQRSLAETELRLRGDLVDDLLTGTDDDSARARSAAVGHDLRPAHQVLVISWPGTDDVEKLARAVDQATTRITHTRALLSRRAGNVVLIASTRDTDHAPYDWTELHHHLRTTLPPPDGAVGVGRLCTHPADLPRSYSEALRALGVRQHTTSHSGVTTFDELGFYRMFSNAESNYELGEYIQEWLGPLIDYDAAHSYELVTTLWQYYECGGNYDATARQLMIHRSTLRYRLRRIRELTGLDLSAVDTRLNLHIATRAWQILHAPA